MPTLPEIYARKKEASGQVSAQTRSLALGLLALTWVLLTAHDEPLRSMAANVNPYLILWLAAISILVIMCDLLQYVAITSMANAAYKRAEASQAKMSQYDNKSFAYKAQATLYYAKFWILAVGAILLLVIFIQLLSPIRPPSQSSRHWFPL